MTTIKVSPEAYQAAIPKHCFYQTFEEHMKNLKLCWGLLESMEENYTLNCRGCEFTRQSPDSPTDAPSL